MVDEVPVGVVVVIVLVFSSELSCPVEAKLQLHNPPAPNLNVDRLRYSEILFKVNQGGGVRWGEFKGSSPSFNS